MTVSILRRGRPRWADPAQHGYGLVAYARDAAAVADSLARHGDPFHLPDPSRRDRYLNLVALELLRREPAALQRAHLVMFARNPAQRVLAFLDATATTALAAQIAALVATLPIAPFTAAAARRLRT